MFWLRHCSDWSATSGRWLNERIERACFFTGDSAIIVSKLGVGHEMDVFLRAVKGVGKQHAKFQPVCTAWHRFHPRCRLVKPIEGRDAIERLYELMPKADDVFDVADRGEETARVRRIRPGMRTDRGIRNLHRDPQLAANIDVGRDRRHCIFTVESVGARPSRSLVLEALDILLAKCALHRTKLQREFPAD